MSSRTREPFSLSAGRRGPSRRQKWCGIAVSWRLRGVKLGRQGHASQRWRFPGISLEQTHIENPFGVLGSSDLKQSPVLPDLRTANGRVRLAQGTEGESRRSGCRHLRTGGGPIGGCDECSRQLLDAVMSKAKRSLRPGSTGWADLVGRGSPKRGPPPTPCRLWPRCLMVGTYWSRRSRQIGPSAQ